MRRGVVRVAIECGARPQAEACCSLGVLYNQQGDFANAVQYLERFFELARSTGDKALLDKARTYLGIARGNAVLPAYMYECRCSNARAVQTCQPFFARAVGRRVVTHDLDALLQWKNRELAHDPHSHSVPHPKPEHAHPPPPPHPTTHPLPIDRIRRPVAFS